MLGHAAINIATTLDIGLAISRQQQQRQTEVQEDHDDDDDDGAHVSSFVAATAASSATKQ